jgi:hypothetical protein
VGLSLDLPQQGGFASAFRPQEHDGLVQIGEQMEQ